MKKATKSFDAKGNCSGRTYEYLMPTYGLAKDYVSIHCTIHCSHLMMDMNLNYLEVSYLTKLVLIYYTTTSTNIYSNYTVLHILFHRNYICCAFPTIHKK